MLFVHWTALAFAQLTAEPLLRNLVVSRISTKFDSYREPIEKGSENEQVHSHYLFLLAPLVGLEPTTYRLTAERSTN